MELYCTMDLSNIFYISILMISVTVHGSLWSRGPTKYDDIINPDSSEFEVRSLLECGAQCSVNGQCSWFSHSTTLKLCQHHNIDSTSRLNTTMVTMKCYVPDNFETTTSTPTTTTTSTTTTSTTTPATTPTSTTTPSSTTSSTTSTTPTSTTTTSTTTPSTTTEATTITTTSTASTTTTPSTTTTTSSTSTTTTTPSTTTETTTTTTTPTSTTSTTTTPSTTTTTTTVPTTSTSTTTTTPTTAAVCPTPDLQTKASLPSGVTISFIIVSAQPLSQTDASSFCLKQGTALLKIDTEEKQVYFKNILTSCAAFTGYDYWIDGTLTNDGTFRYSDSTSMPLDDTVYWASGYPVLNKLTRCVAMQQDSDYKWKNVECTNVIRIICAFTGFDYWIDGAMNGRGAFYFSDGTIMPLDDTVYWASGYPVLDRTVLCVAMTESSAFKWNNVACSSQLRMICS